MGKINSPGELETYRKAKLAKVDPRKPCITVCSGTACEASGSDKLSFAFENELRKAGLLERIDLRKTGCHGFCEQGPIVTIHPNGTCYVRVRPEDVSEVVSQSLVGNNIIDRLLYIDPI